MGYNSATLKDNCTLFAPTSSPMVSFKFLRCRPSLPWQRILEQNWL